MSFTICSLIDAEQSTKRVDKTREGSGGSRASSAAILAVPLSLGTLVISGPALYTFLHQTLRFRNHGTLSGQYIYKVGSKASRNLQNTQTNISQITG